jgi:hypothetical protein
MVKLNEVVLHNESSHHKEYGGEEVQIYSFVISAGDGGQ